jgi:hypothetical protein
MFCLYKEGVEELLKIDVLIYLSIKVLHNSVRLNSLKDPNQIVLDNLDGLHLHSTDVFIYPKLVIIN